MSSLTLVKCIAVTLLKCCKIVDHTWPLPKKISDLWELKMIDGDHHHHPITSLLLIFTLNVSFEHHFQFPMTGFRGRES